MPGISTTTLDEVDGGPIEWDRPLRPVPCGIELHEIDGHFETEWGSLGDNILETGGGSITMVDPGSPPVPAQLVRALAGMDGEDVVLAVGFGPLANRDYGLLRMKFP